MPTQEQFDTMTNAEFEFWWDTYIQRVQAEAVHESEVEAAFEAYDRAVMNRCEPEACW